MSFDIRLCAREIGLRRCVFGSASVHVTLCSLFRRDCKSAYGGSIPPRTSKEDLLNPRLRGGVFHTHDMR
jgi:hypothetical protein